MSDFLILVGNRIRSIRKEQGLTQEELAEKADLQHSYIGGIERGERNISLLTLEKVVRSLNTNPSNFFEFSDFNSSSANYNQILLLHEDLLRKRSISELRAIHNITKEIIRLIDSE